MNKQHWERLPLKQIHRYRGMSQVQILPQENLVKMVMTMTHQQQSATLYHLFKWSRGNL